MKQVNKITTKLKIIFSRWNTYSYMIFSILCFLSCPSLLAQEQPKDYNLPKGNDLFADKNYVDAEAEYRISQSKFKKKSIASYNLGTSIYRQNFSGEAKLHFAKAANEAKTKPERKQAFHNLDRKSVV